MIDVIFVVMEICLNLMRGFDSWDIVEENHRSRKFDFKIIVVALADLLIRGGFESKPRKFPPA